MGDRLGRNDSCWCGSGYKYKRCHLGRETDSRPELSESTSAFKRAQSRKVCLHPDASRDECRGPIVKAHTVQKDLLIRVARNRHVYGFPIDFGAILSTSGVPTPRLIGINRASTFTGFCGKHDAELFRPIETLPIRACEEHACLLAYRSLCREMHAKEGVEELDAHFRSMDRGLPVSDQLHLQDECNRIMAGTQTALRDIRVRKAQYDQVFRTADYSPIKYCVFWLERPPDIMCSASKYPTRGFDGRRLQCLSDLQSCAHAISLSLLASGDKGCAFFSWLEDDDTVCLAFLESLINQDPAAIPHALVRFVFSSFENQYLRPDWWDELGEPTRQKLLSRFVNAIHPYVPIPADYLKDDGVRAVKWIVCGRETNSSSLR